MRARVWPRLTLAAASHPAVDISVAVLGQGFWPVQPNPTDYTIPADLAKHYDRFVRYYNSKHSCVALFRLASALRRARR